MTRLALHLPPRPLLGSILLRGLMAWAVMRSAATFVIGVPDPGSLATLLVAPLVAAFALVAVLGDLARRNEFPLLRNAGIGAVDVTAVTLGLIVLLEGALLLILTAVL